MDKDKYKTAVDLYICSIRALEQRSMAFLIVQSFLVAGYVGLLIQDKNSLEGFMWGIIAIGIIICGSFFIAGKTTSLDASVWRSYMEMIESKESTASEEIKPPWDYFGETYRKRAGCFTRTAIDKLPGPTLWIWSPAVFLAAWTFALIMIFIDWQWPCKWQGLHFLYIIPVLIIIGSIFYYFCGTRIKK